MIGQRHCHRGPAVAGVLALPLLLLIVPGIAWSDSIDPAQVDAAITRNQTLTVHKTVTVSMEPPPNAPVDVFFLFDTTGSMAPFIEATKLASAQILDGVSGLGDLAFGVGSYQDFPLTPWGGITDVPYEQVQDLSGDVSQTIASIGSLDTSFGGDVPESQIHGLTQVATTTSWRQDSTRVVVWFGDAPGHDGSLDAGYPLPESLDDAIHALNAENIVVQAIDVAAPPAGLDATGQATDITDATGGILFDGNSDDPDVIADMVVDAIEDVVLTYQTVELELVGDTDFTTVEITPDAIEGDFDRRDGDRVFEFVVDITAGDELGVDEFEIRALVDGVPVAVESDRVEVVPEPTAVAFYGLGSLLVSAAVRRRSRP